MHSAAPLDTPLTIGHVLFFPAACNARSAVGTNALPLNIAVEVEAIVEVMDDKEWASTVEMSAYH